MKNVAKLKILLPALAFLMAATPSFAQLQNDFGTWVNVMAVKSWDKPYAYLRAEHRTALNASTTEAFFLAAGGGYKFTKWLNADLSYEFWDVPPLDKLAESKFFHKVVLTALGTLRRENLAASVRGKYELAINNANGNVTNLLRVRLRGQYTIGESVFTPYLMYEIFAGLEGEGWIRSLHYVGCDIRLAKCLALDVFYNYNLFDAGDFFDNGSRHILGVGFNFNF